MRSSLAMFGTSLALLMAPASALAQDKGGGEDAPAAASNEKTVSSKLPCVSPSTKVTMDFADAPLMDVTKYMAEITCRNFILSDDLKGTITIISHQQVTVGEAYEAYLSALEVAGYTTVTVGRNTKIVQTSSASKTPLRVYEGDEIPATDNFVTQIINLDNVSVSDITSVVQELSGPQAKIIGYAPTNTMIVTDAAYNIRRVYRIVKQLDVAAPRSTLEVIPIRYAAAADVQRILEEIYGVSASSSGGSSSATRSSSGDANGGARRPRRGDAAASAPAGASATNVGAEGAYISKIIADERTNSLILMANEEALDKVKELIARIDVDIDPASRSQIHVIYLQHAEATEVAGVLSSLSGGSGSGSRSSSGTSRTGTSSSSSRRTGGGSSSSSGGSSSSKGAAAGVPRPDAPGLPGGAGEGGAATSGVAAAFDSGSVRIAADESTNALIIIAPPEEYRILSGVIQKLDIERRQVFVDVVVMEVGSTDELNASLGLHSGISANGSVAGGLAGMSLGTSSVTPDLASLLSGLAVGVFGDGVDIAFPDGAGGTTTLSIPTFGIVMQALASNQGVNIVSNPNLMVLDNEEATINVGRNVPFPVSAGRDSNNNPIVSYQREDVGITLAVTPQINESNYVTLDLSLEVAEVEESSGGSVENGGFITSKRETENVVVVKDNQTIVIGGLIGTTQTQTATKVPFLGDIPVLGVLFRTRTESERKTNLLIFLTPHIITEPSDLEDVYRVKMAQRQEFMRLFYGKSREEQEEVLNQLLLGSMNMVDQASVYRTKPPPKLEHNLDEDLASPSAVPAPAQPPTNDDAPPYIAPAPEEK